MAFLIQAVDLVKCTYEESMLYELDELLYNESYTYLYHHSDGEYDSTCNDHWTSDIFDRACCVPRDELLLDATGSCQRIKNMFVFSKMISK